MGAEADTSHESNIVPRTWPGDTVASRPSNYGKHLGYISLRFAIDTLREVQHGHANFV